MLDFNGKTILITSGPTYAFIDAVRVISNRSSGRLGSTIANQFSCLGANVIQLAGENSLTARLLDPQSRVRVQTYGTVNDLKNQLKDQILSQSPAAVIMAAAVLDYLPADPSHDKKSSQEDEWWIRMVKGEKIIEQIKTWEPNLVLVGFKLETNISLDELSERALHLINRSGASLVVANLLEEINQQQHQAYFFEKTSQGEARMSSPYSTPAEISQALCHRVFDLIDKS